MPSRQASYDRAETAGVQQANHHLLAARKDEATWPDRNAPIRYSRILRP
jgi:hypothetical protein